MWHRRKMSKNQTRLKWFWHPFLLLACRKSTMFHSCGASLHRLIAIILTLSHTNFLFSTLPSFSPNIRDTDEYLHFFFGCLSIEVQRSESSTTNMKQLIIRELVHLLRWNNCTQSQRHFMCCYNHPTSTYFIVAANWLIYIWWRWQESLIWQCHLTCS